MRFDYYELAKILKERRLELGLTIRNVEDLKKRLNFVINL